MDAAAGFDLQCMLEKAIDAHKARKGCMFRPDTNKSIRKTLAYRVTKVCVWWLGKVLERYEICLDTDKVVIDSSGDIWRDLECNVYTMRARSARNALLKGKGEQDAILVQ